MSHPDDATSSTQPRVPQQRVPATTEPEAPSTGLWERMRADPQYAPEHLALEAVERIGPAANAWAAALREREPGLAPDAMAHRAVNRFTRHAQLSGAISGAAGLPGAVLDLGVLAWTQCRLVLHVAAAYGVDATHPDRATDLLVLQKVHKAAEGARLALGVATGRERIGSAVATLAGGASRRRAFGQLALKLARMAGVRAVRRLVAKILPFASIILGTWANSAATKELAGRTMEHYQSVSPLLHPAATDPSSAS